MKARPFASLSDYWNQLSIKYKIVVISASLITLRIILNGNYFLGYQQLEKYHEFEHQVHFASTKLYTFKSTFSEIFFTDGALPQIEQSQRLLADIIMTFASLHTHHGKEMMFHSRIVQLEKSARQLQITVEQVMQTPGDLSFNNPDAMIILGKVTAMTNQLFNDVHRLIEDVTLYSGQMRDKTFNSMITMGLVIFSVGILFLIMLYRGVMGPLKLLDEMRNLIRRVRTEGDLSAKLHGESDTEVGRLAHDFNALISSLDKNLGKTSQTVSLVAGHVERLSNEVRQSHDEISTQQHEIFHLSNTVRKMAETLNTLTEHAQSASSYVGELGHHAREGGELLEQFKAISLTLDSHINAARQQLEKLNENCLTLNNGEQSKESQAAAELAYGHAISQLHYYSTEAANNIEFTAGGLGEQRNVLHHADRPTQMIHKLSESIDHCTQMILTTIEAEKEVLQTISRDIDEIATLENHAAFTSNLITSASDELLYLSRLLSAEVQRFHTSDDKSSEKIQTG